LGIVVALLQAFIWASATVVLRVLSTRVNGFVVNGLRAVAAWVFLIPVILLRGGLADWPLLRRARGLLLGSVVLAAWWETISISSASSAWAWPAAFPITSSHPVFTVLLGILFLGDPAEPRTLVGMFVVLFGVYLVARPRRDVIAIDNRHLWSGGNCSAAWPSRWPQPSSGRPPPSSWPWASPTASTRCW
jgi:drug/metabolite transporter (DMT)-like permease